MRDRILLVSNYVVSGYMSDPGAARGQALMALGQTIEKQPLIAANGDVLAAVGMTLIALAWLVLFIAKGLQWPVRPRRSDGWPTGGGDRRAASAYSGLTAGLVHQPTRTLYDEAITAHRWAGERPRHGTQSLMRSLG